MENNQPSEWAMKKAKQAIEKHKIGMRSKIAFSHVLEICIAKELDSLKSQADELASQLSKIIVSHENLYKMCFGENSNPQSDCIRRDAEKALSNYRKGE